jgi:putative phosphoesterase
VPDTVLRSVAVLSDIHGALPVLDAVLAEPLVRAADLIVVTGDHAAGPMPVEVLDRLQDLGEKVLLVRGNADRDLVSIASGDGGLVDPPPVDLWAAKQLRPEHVRLLASLPHPVTLQVEGFGHVLFCHGTPRDDNEVVLVDTRIERWAEAFAGLEDSVQTVVCGHTHMPFVRLVDRRLVVNSGSVGMPYGVRGASWALLDHGAVTLHRTSFDAVAVAQQIRDRSSFAEVDAWVSDYILHPAGDAEAIEVFGPRDGR